MLRRRLVARGLARIRDVQTYRGELSPLARRELRLWRIESLLHRMAPREHPLIATVANCRGNGTKHDRHVVHVADDAALLRPVEKGRESDFGIAVDTARLKVASFDDLCRAQPRRLGAGRR